MQQFVLLLALTFVSMASAAAEEGLDELSKAARSFLMAIDEAKLDLEQTAISPFIKPDQRSRVLERHERLAIGLRGAIRGVDGRLLLEEVARKQDDGLAILLLSYGLRERPFEKHFESLTLVRQKEAWKVSPMPGSFEYTLIGFDKTKRASGQRLIAWADRRIIELIDESGRLAAGEFAERMQRVSADLPGEEAGPLEYVLSFRKALRQGNVDLALAHCLEAQSQPGKDGNLTPDLTDLAVYFGKSIRSDSTTPLYRYLVQAPSIIAPGPINQMDNETELVLFHRDIFESGNFSIEYQLRRRGGRWFLKFPSQLAAGAVRNRWMWQTEEDELASEFGPSFLESSLLLNWPSETAASAEILADQLLKKLQDGNAQGVLLHLETLCPEMILSLMESCSNADITKLMQTCYQLAAPARNRIYADCAGARIRQMRQARIGAPDVRIASIEVVTDGDYGLWFWAAANLTKLEDLRVFTMPLVKSSSGWRLALLGQGEMWRERKEVFAALDKDDEKLHQRALTQMMESLNADLVLTEAEVLGSFEREALVAAWNQLAGRAERNSSFDLYIDCALFAASAKADPKRALSDLSNVLRGLKADIPKARDMEFKVLGRLGLVSFRIPSDSGPDRALILIFGKVAERVLLFPELQLEVARNYGREIVNRSVWSQIEKYLDADELEPIKACYEALKKATDEEEAGSPAGEAGENG